MSKQGVHTLVQEGVRSLGLTLDKEAVEKLIAFAALLGQAGLRFNIISRKNLDWDSLWRRHLMDSLQAVPELLGPHVVDVGSGSGLPGIPLAIARRDLEVTLLERSARRCDFLRHAKMRLNLDGLNIEEADVRSRWQSGTFDTATARALAKPDRAVSLLLPLVREGGRLVLFVGQGAFEALELSGKRSLRLLRSGGHG